MAITHAGFTGTVDQVDFSKILDGLSGHGVVGTYNDSSLSAAKVVGSRTMLVQPGYVYAPGVQARLDTAANATAAAALVGSNPRIDVLIAKFNWNTGAVTFEMKAGTQAASPVPPALQQDPGDIFEVPLRQGTLTNAVGGEYTTATMTDRRYWLEDGHFVMPSTTALPQDPKAGMSVIHPDVKQILVHNGSNWDTFKAYVDTGWNPVSMSPPSGYTGTVNGRKLNGEASIVITWTRTAGSATGITLLTTIPSGWIPSERYTIAGWKGNEVCRVIANPDATLTVGPINAANGDIIRAVINYIPA